MKIIYKTSFFFISTLIWQLSILPAHAEEAAKPVETPAVQITEKTEESVPQTYIPRGMSGHYLSSQFARNNGDTSRAIRFLRRAYYQDPKNVEVMAQLQGLYLINGEVADAIEFAKKMPENAPDQSLTALLLAVDAVKRDDIVQATAILDSAFKDNRGQLWLPLAMAWLDVAHNKLTKPIHLADNGDEATRASALVQYHLALINQQGGFKEAAVENYSKSVADPENPPTRIMEMLVKFYNENDKPAGLKPMVEAYHNDNPEGIYVSEDIKGPMTPKEGIAEVLFTMGNIVQSAGVTQDAIIYMHLARYLKPEFPLVAMNLGDAYSDMQQYIKANVYYGTIEKDSQLYIKARIRMAMNENARGELERAITQLEKLAREMPKEYEPLVVKADLLRMNKRYSEAAELYTQAIQKIEKPQNYHWPLYFSRGVTLEQLGRWDEGEEDLEFALTLRPEQPDVLNYLGYTWLTRGEHLHKAREVIEKASSSRPNDPHIMDSMGWALYTLRKYDEAVAYMERAVELMPADPTVNHHLGDIYWRLGRTTEARFQWERSLTFSPEPEEAERIQHKLKAGLEPEIAGNTPIVAERAKPAAISLP